MPENPIFLSTPHSIMAAASAPDCEIRASGPLPGRCAAKLALRPACGNMTPKQFGPMMRSLWERAIRATASAIEPAPWPRPEEMMTAPATPSLPASSMISGMAGAGAVITMRSGTNGKDDRLGDVVNPPIDRCLGFTTAISPTNPPSRKLRRTFVPSDEGRGLPPTSARVRGANALCNPKSDIAICQKREPDRRSRDRSQPARYFVCDGFLKRCSHSAFSSQVSPFLTLRYFDDPGLTRIKRPKDGLGFMKQH